MEKITTADGLRAAIEDLEFKQAVEAISLREHFKVIYESLKPVNLIRSIFVESSGAGEIKDNVISKSLGLTAGYLSKMVFELVMKSPAKKLIGTAIMFGIRNLISRNPEIVKSIGKGVLNVVRSRTSARD